MKTGLEHIDHEDADAQSWVLTLSGADAARMHPDRLAQMRSGLRSISEALAEPDRPTPFGDARRAIRRMMREGLFR